MESIRNPFITRLNQLIDQSICFFLFRRPHEKEPHLILVEPSQISTVHNLQALNDKNGYIIAPFVPDETHPVILLPLAEPLSGWEKITSFLSTMPGPDSARLESNPHFEPKDNKTDANYNNAFELFKQELAQGHCQKIVLSRPMIIEKPTAFSAGLLFEKACQQFPEAYVYLSNNPISGCWFGSSPELLLTSQHNRWNTVAIAGTQSATGEAPVWDNKNKTEQALVAKFLKERINELGLKVEISDTYTFRTGNLLHLKTDFSFLKTERVKVGTLLDILHPTPAVCGYPPEVAKPLILDNEGYDRSYYTGFLGLLSDAQTDLHVNLRCLKIETSTLTLYAGGGLMPDSDRETEWKETVVKMQTLLSLLD